MPLVNRVHGYFLSQTGCEVISAVPNISCFIFRIVDFFLYQSKIIPNQETQPDIVHGTEYPGQGVDPDKFEEKSIIIGLNTGYKKVIGA